MRIAHFIENALRYFAARGKFLAREVAQHMHEPAQRRKIDVRFDNIMSELSQCRIEILAPESAIVMARIIGMSDSSVDPQANCFLRQRPQRKSIYEPPSTPYFPNLETRFNKF